MGKGYGEKGIEGVRREGEMELKRCGEKGRKEKGMQERRTAEGEEIR